MNNIKDRFEALLKESNLINDYNKNKKIKINDSSIDDLPLIAYPGLNTEQCLKINELAKKVLYMSKYENDNNEVVITYSLEEQKLRNEDKTYMTIVKGDKSETNIEGDTDTYHLLNTTRNAVLVNLHNHPSGSDFSMNDIMFFILYSSVKLMVLIPNDGGIFYLSKNEDYNRQKNIHAFGEIVSKIKPEAYNNGVIDFGKLSFKEMADIAESYTKVSHTLGVDYKFEPNQPQEEKEKDDDDYEY